MTQFNAVDLVVMVLYVSTLIYLGVRGSMKNKNSEEFFVGKRSFPAWAIGLSMMGTIPSFPIRPENHFFWG